MHLNYVRLNIESHRGRQETVVITGNFMQLCQRHFLKFTIIVVFG